MNKIQEIFTAWNISFNPNDEQAELASKRIEVCNSCEHKKQNTFFKNVCDLCGCSLSKKVFTPIVGACPDGRWNDIDNAVLKNKPMRNLRFVCAQPTIPYYTWQVEVMLNNFMEMGINLNNVDVVCHKENGVIPDDWSKLANKYPARFLFYNDTRETKHYISSIRPNILKQHWQRFPELKDEVIFYHDCDIIFTKPPSSWITNEMLTDNKWYGSDTRFYISAEYIQGKGEQILDAMCAIVGIDKEVVISNEMNCIGAQYLMKGIDYQFWDDVERDCERLFKEITELNNEIKKEKPDYHELQIWCADMFSVLWNGWKQNVETVVHSNFNFSWGTSNEEVFNKNNIFHNAGVTTSSGGLFYKAEYMKSLPYSLSLDIKADTASKKYYQWVQEVGKKSVLKSQ
jgi:hypothetical protein